MAAKLPKILSIEIKSNGDNDNEMLFRFGTVELSKVIPNGHSFVRASAILDNEGNLADCELITAKL